MHDIPTKIHAQHTAWVKFIVIFYYVNCFLYNLFTQHETRMPFIVYFVETFDSKYTELTHLQTVWETKSFERCFILLF